MSASIKMLTLALATLALTVGGSAASGTGQTWTAETCSGPDAKVTFSKCCGEEKYCSRNGDRGSCGSGESALYCQWSEAAAGSAGSSGSPGGGKCIPRPDDRSDVCCRNGKVGDACHSLAYKMECPKDWLVRTECCPDPEARKYSGLLGGSTTPGMVCCNAPCQQMQKANCTLDPRCAPNKRSLAMTYNPYQNLGFFYKRPQDVQGRPLGKTFGNLIYGTGLANDDSFLAQYMMMMSGGGGGGMMSPGGMMGGVSPPGSGQSGFDQSKDSHVDEITVDDLFELLIEALQDDTDVKVYSAQIDSDPLFGKVTTGGFKANLNLPDADFFLNRIYGSPYGLSPPVMAMPAAGSTGRMGQSLIGGYNFFGSAAAAGGMMGGYPPYYPGGYPMYGGSSSLPSYPYYGGGGGGSSFYGGSTSTYGGSTPMYGSGFPTYGGGSTPMYGSGGTPTYGGGTPTYGGGTPTYGGGTPTYGGGTPMYGSGGTPTYGGSTPIYGSGGTPTYGGSTPTYPNQPYGV